MDQPFFTVVIPTFNRSMFLWRAIESVIEQDFDSMEIIIVDDNSTDNTREVAEGFSDKRIIYQKNERKKGACGARNVGINVPLGEWEKIPRLQATTLVGLRYYEELSQNLSFGL